MTVFFWSYCKDQFPFNKDQFKIHITLFVCMFSSSFSITMLFPFIPFMIQFLLPTIDPKSVGIYAGIIASSVWAGRFFGSYMWGLLSDIWGKKRVLIISELLLGLSSLAFGYSVNIYMAVILRFLVGLSNGIVGIARAAVSEVCTDKTQPLALGILTTALGVGLVAGPAVSGTIADPITQYNLTINNHFLRQFLTTFPYSLPGIVHFLLCVLGMILASVLLPQSPKRTSLQSIVVPNSQQPLVQTVREKEKKKKSPEIIMQRLCKGFVKAVDTLKMFMKDSTTRLVLLIYCTYSFFNAGYDELYPLWCSTAPNLGGLGFSLYDIGISLTVIGILLFPFSLLIFPLLEKFLGSIKSFQLAMIVQMFFILLLPSVHFMLLLRENIILWIVLCVVGFIIKVATSVRLSATALFINNSVTFSKRGSLNGLAISLTAAFRTISPLFVGTVYSTSLSNSTRSIGFPVDYHLIFIILSFVLLTVALMSTRLPLTINQKFVEEKD